VSTLKQSIDKVMGSTVQCKACDHPSSVFTWLEICLLQTVSLMLLPATVSLWLSVTRLSYHLKSNWITVSFVSLWSPQMLFKRALWWNCWEVFIGPSGLKCGTDCSKWMFISDTSTQCNQMMLLTWCGSLYLTRCLLSNSCFINETGTRGQSLLHSLLNCESHGSSMRLLEENSKCKICITLFLRVMTLFSQLGGSKLHDKHLTTCCTWLGHFLTWELQLWNSKLHCNILQRLCIGSQMQGSKL
jgi:hypothetical protein